MLHYLNAILEYINFKLCELPIILCLKYQNNSQFFYSNNIIQAQFPQAYSSCVVSCLQTFNKLSTMQPPCITPSVTSRVNSSGL